jgi:hypothetical protein
MRFTVTRSPIGTKTESSLRAFVGVEDGFGLLLGVFDLEAGRALAAEQQARLSWMISWFLLMVSEGARDVFLQSLRSSTL